MRGNFFPTKFYRISFKKKGAKMRSPLWVYDLFCSAGKGRKIGSGIDPVAPKNELCIGIIFYIDFSWVGMYKSCNTECETCQSAYNFLHALPSVSLCPLSLVLVFCDPFRSFIHELLISLRSVASNF